MWMSVVVVVEGYYYSVSGPLIAAFTAVTTLIAKAAAMHSGLRGDVNSVDVFLM